MISEKIGFNEIAYPRLSKNGLTLAVFFLETVEEPRSIGERVVLTAEWIWIERIEVQHVDTPSFQYVSK